MLIDQNWLIVFVQKLSLMDVKDANGLGLQRFELKRQRGIEPALSVIEDVIEVAAGLLEVLFGGPLHFRKHREPANQLVEVCKANDLGELDSLLNLVKVALYLAIRVI